MQKFLILNLTSSSFQQVTNIFQFLDFMHRLPGIEEAPLFDSSTKLIVGVCKSKSFVKALTRCTSSFVAVSFLW